MNDEPSLTVEEVLRDFEEHRRWPKDVADYLASNSASESLLWELMQRDSPRHQSLALHVIAQRIEADPTWRPATRFVAEVERLLQRETFKPKRRHLIVLSAWAQLAR